MEGKKKHGILKWVIIAIIIIAIAGAAASKDDDEPKKVGEVESTEKTDGGNSSSTTAASTEAANSEFVVGDIVEQKNLKVSFLSAGEYTSDNEFMQPKEGNVYYRVEFEFENIGDEDETISSMIGFELYADGYACDQSFIGDDDLSATISKGRKVKGSVYYEVPAESKEIVLEYKDNPYLDDKIVFKVK